MSASRSPPGKDNYKKSSAYNIFVISKKSRIITLNRFRLSLTPVSIWYNVILVGPNVFISLCIHSQVCPVQRRCLVVGISCTSVQFCVKEVLFKPNNKLKCIKTTSLNVL